MFCADALRARPAPVAAQALCAMVERHLTIEVIRNGRDMHEAVRQLTELWFRAVYAGGGTASGAAGDTA